MLAFAITSDWTTAVATVVLALTAVATVFIAYWQLSNLNRTLTMSGLSVVLQLEAEMNCRKEKVDDVLAKLREEANKTSRDEKQIEILRDQMQGYFENWLNAADRFAYCIMRGHFSELDWKADYRDYFTALVRDHPEKFGPATIHNNILDLYNKWRKE